MTHGLETRLQEVEDRLAIYNLIASHSPIIDTQSNSLMKEMFTSDGILDRGELGETHIAQIGPNQPDMDAALEQGLAHFGTLPYVVMKADRATAISYVGVTVLEPALAPIVVPMHGRGAGHRLFRMTANRWELLRTPSGWRVERREVFVVDGTDKPRDLFRSVLAA